MIVYAAANLVRCAALYLITAGLFKVGIHGFQSVVANRRTVTCRHLQSSTDSTVSMKEEASTTPGSTTKEMLFRKWMNSNPVWDEVPHPGRSLLVVGSIPSYVNGRYIKNGPGAFSTPDGSRRYTHAFDGLARLQKYDIVEGGDVTFTTRYINSKLYQTAQTTNEIPGHLAVGPVEPPFSYPDILLNTFNMDNTCVNVDDLSSTGTFVAVTDADVMNRIDPSTLETIGLMPKENIQGTSGLTTFSTAHAKRSPKTGLTYNYHLDIGLAGNFAHIVRTNKDLTKTSIGKVKVGRQFSYVHEISMTENYAVLVLCPALIDMAKFIQQKCLLPSLQFDENKPTQICLFDIEGQKPVEVFEGPPLWTFHHVNAYENASGAVVLDLIAYETAAIANGPHGYLYMDNMVDASTRGKQEREGQVWRFTLDPRASDRKVVPEKKIILDSATGKEITMELTSVAPEVLSRPYRYVYGFTGFYRGQLGYMDWAIYKQDVVDNANAGVWYEEFMYPGEVTFVKNPEGSDEDDGVLLSTVYDSRLHQNCLLVLDAQTMKEMARAYTGVACPQSFHGKFYPFDES